MTGSEEEFLRSLRETFRVEAEEHLASMSSLLLSLEKSPSPAECAKLIENTYREAHTLKGAARAVDLRDVETICQGLESILSDWKKQAIMPPREAFDALHRSIDSIRKELMESGHGYSISDMSPPAILETEPLAVTVKAAPDSPADSVAVTAPEPTRETQKPPAIDTVRISISKLDSRLLQAEDMLVIKSMAAMRAAELRYLTGKMSAWWKQWKKISGELGTLQRGNSGKNGAQGTMGEFLEWNCDFIRSLQGNLEAMASQAQQDKHGIDRRIDDLLEDSKKLLMLPFSTVSGIFLKLVRDLCRDQGKECELTIIGNEVEIDKRILEEMKDALIHLLRNCIDHGVEAREERLHLKKPLRANITIAVSQVNGSKVEIAVKDDGAGIDVEAVRASAIRKGLISAAEAAKLSEAEAQSLVFQSEVSTSPIVTSVSGRGLGMAIVRAKAEGLGGRVTIESKRHQGTTLRFLLPLTMATFRGVLVMSVQQIFVVPAPNIEQAIFVKADDIKSVENREVILFRGQTVALVRLGALLGQTRESRAGEKQIAVLVLHSAGQRIAFVVDEVLHEEEVLVKPLRKPLVRVPNIAGATVLESGKVACVLHIGDLFKSARLYGAPPALRAESVGESKSTARRILIVEDSITSRMLLKGILESAGYHVHTAADGLEAFALLREDSFDLVVSDVEMPRLNGFDLTTRIRADKRLADLPVVLITALESREQRERGIDAGASAYIVKSRFDQGNLLETVRRLI